MQSFVIESDGSQATPGANRVIDIWTNEVKFFSTRREARAYRDSILPEMPSKYLPLRVREAADAR